jgi:hypothetical protein
VQFARGRHQADEDSGAAERAEPFVAQDDGLGVGLGDWLDRIAIKGGDDGSRRIARLRLSDQSLVRGHNRTS